MATNFSPSSGSYVLNKFPSISKWRDTGPSWPSSLMVLQKSTTISFCHNVLCCTEKTNFRWFFFFLSILYTLLTANAFNLTSTKFLIICYPLLKQALVFTCLLYKSVKKCWKRRNCLTSHFSLPTMFSCLLENFPLFSSNLKLLSANSFTLEESKIRCLGNS